MTAIKARAPARIDLAGGTLDIWPLYLFFENTATINCAINQYAEVSLAPAGPGDGSAVELGSEDRGERHAFRSYGELIESFQGSHKAKLLPSALWLHARVARHFLAFWRRPFPLRLSTRCASPVGAGLGGSSALNIALCAAMRRLTQANLTDEELIPLARDLETTVIDVPAGIQDYWSALFGGVQAIRMEAGRVHRKVFCKQAPFIEKHVILCYSGQSRSSGINNWAVMKGFIDGDREIRAAFTGIVKATARVEEALEHQSLERLVEGIRGEWEARQRLAPTIATEEMRAVIAKAEGWGALAAKVCGAGGGGCFILVAPEEKKPLITQKLRADGVQVLDFRVVEEGCRVES